MDDTVDPAALIKLMQKFEFAEFGLAYRHPVDKPGSRNASEKYIKELVEIPACKERLALHLSGEAAIESFLSDDPDSFVVEIAQQFPLRIQPNLTDIRQPGETCMSEWERLDFVTRAHPGQTVIVPILPNEVRLAEEMNDIPNLDFIHDESGGKGILPVERPAPVRDRLTIYAGGYALGNLATELPKTQAAAKGQEFGIDAETGVGENGRFSISKAEEFLTIVEEFRRNSGVFARNAAAMYNI